MEELTFSGVKASVGRGKEVVERREKEVIEERGKEMSVVMGEETLSETQEELERKAAREELEHLKKTFNIRSHLKFVRFICDPKILLLHVFPYITGNVHMDV